MTIFDQAKAELMNDQGIIALADDSEAMTAAIAGRLPALLIAIHERNSRLAAGTGWVGEHRAAAIDAIAEHIWHEVREESV